MNLHASLVVAAAIFIAELAACMALVAAVQTW